MRDDLARAFVACPGWQWLPGMLVMSDPTRVPRAFGAPVHSSDLRARVTSVVLGRWFGAFVCSVDFPDAEHETASGDDLPGTLPDLDDPATLGCILELVRRAWGDPTIHVVAYHTTVGPDIPGAPALWWALARAPDPLAEWIDRVAPASRLVVLDTQDDYLCARPTVAETLLLALQSAPSTPTAGE